MSANDPDDFVRRGDRLAQRALRENKPFLGICLGAQMLVRHLGGKVEAEREERTEIGWYPIRPTEHGRLLMPWRDGLSLPSRGLFLPHGAMLLATGDIYPNQAFRYGENAWGVQFHAELTTRHDASVGGAWRPPFRLPNAQQGREHLEGRMIFDAPLKAWLSAFLDLVFTRA